MGGKKERGRPREEKEIQRVQYIYDETSKDMKILMKSIPITTKRSRDRL